MTTNPAAQATAFSDDDDIDTYETFNNTPNYTPVNTTRATDYPIEIKIPASPLLNESSFCFPDGDMELAELSYGILPPGVPNPFTENISARYKYPPTQEDTPHTENSTMDTGTYHTPLTESSSEFFIKQNTQTEDYESEEPDNAFPDPSYVHSISSEELSGNASTRSFFSRSIKRSAEFLRRRSSILSRKPRRLSVHIQYRSHKDYMHTTLVEEQTRIDTIQQDLEMLATEHPFQDPPVLITVPGSPFHWNTTFSFDPLGYAQQYTNNIQSYLSSNIDPASTIECNRTLYYLQFRLQALNKLQVSFLSKKLSHFIALLENCQHVVDVQNVRIEELELQIANKEHSHEVEEETDRGSQKVHENHKIFTVQKQHRADFKYNLKKNMSTLSLDQIKQQRIDEIEDKLNEIFETTAHLTFLEQGIEIDEATTPQETQVPSVDVLEIKEFGNCKAMPLDITEYQTKINLLTKELEEQHQEIASKQIHIEDLESHVQTLLLRINLLQNEKKKRGVRTFGKPIHELENVEQISAERDKYKNDYIETSYLYTSLIEDTERLQRTASKKLSVALERASDTQRKLDECQLMVEKNKHEFEAKNEEQKLTIDKLTKELELCKIRLESKEKIDPIDTLNHQLHMAFTDRCTKLSGSDETESTTGKDIQKPLTIKDIEKMIPTKTTDTSAHTDPAEIDQLREQLAVTQNNYEQLKKVLDETKQLKKDGKETLRLLKGIDNLVLKETKDELKIALNKVKTLEKKLDASNSKLVEGKHLLKTELEAEYQAKDQARVEEIRVLQKHIADADEYIDELVLALEKATLDNNVV